ncbi:MAG: hypothetical protein IJ187_02325 [Neisseriaceae bacterium]|nr:hypothetical protein [Neisseriaceae bacterium]MBQ9258676.1 hypothetical protein [Neisseriaceae bacterium]MBQ9724376.1 hypothetical protein [Neisseriaceae bacterium]MBR1818988.1 hypothetical protein [Neisseriaceae bacterium]
MKKITLLFVCLLPCISLAQTEEIKQLQKKCANEQSSAFKKTNGTPSCDQLDRIYYGKQTPQHSTLDLQRKCANEQSSAFKNTRGTPSCDHLDRLHEYQRPEKAKPQPIVVEQLEYWYEGNQYCGHNAKGETVHCY